MEIDQRIYIQSSCDEDHQEKFKKVTSLGKKIMHCLGSNSLLFLEYESAVGILNNSYMKKAYIIGLEDAQLNESCPTKCLTKT